MAQPKLVESEWITKQEAAKMLGVHLRQVEKRISQGYIEKRFLPRKMNERQARVEVSRRDVEALKAGTPNHTEQVAEPEPKKIDAGMKKALAQYVGAGLPALTTEGSFAMPLIPEAQLKALCAQTEASLSLNKAWSALAEHLAKLSAAFPPPRRDWPAWLTLEDAAEYSGLPAPELKRLLNEGLVYSFGRGPKTWRVQRAALDAYGQAAHQ